MKKFEKAAQWMQENKHNIDCVVIRCIRDTYFIRGYMENHQSRTAEKVIDVLGLVPLIGSKMSFNTPTGSTAYVFPENIDKY